MYFETECEMAVQGHPRSLILVPIDSAYATLYSVAYLGFAQGEVRGSNGSPIVGSRDEAPVGGLGD